MVIIEYFQFYFFERYYVGDQFCFCFFLLWMFGNKVIFNYLLMERFVGYFGWVVYFGQLGNFIEGFGSYCWDNLVYYC